MHPDVKQQVKEHLGTYNLQKRQLNNELNLLVSVAANGCSRVNRYEKKEKYNYHHHIAAECNVEIK